MAVPPGHVAVLPGHVAVLPGHVYLTDCLVSTVPSVDNAQKPSLTYTLRDGTATSTAPEKSTEALALLRCAAPCLLLWHHEAGPPIRSDEVQTWVAAAAFQGPCPTSSRQQHGLPAGRKGLSTPAGAAAAAGTPGSLVLRELVSTGRGPYAAGATGAGGSVLSGAAGCTISKHPAGEQGVVQLLQLIL